MKLFMRVSPTQAIKEFSELPADNAAQANAFFEKFGAGNSPFWRDNPYERLTYYEFLLNSLLEHDPQKYQAIHKWYTLLYDGLVSV